MAYEMRFYCQRPGAASAVAAMVQGGVLARYPGASFRRYPPQAGIREFDIDASTGATLYVLIDVDAARVGTARADMPDAPAGLSATTSIARVVASGAADPALLMACATTFVVDLGAVLWDEMDGFDVTLSW
ncbi:hypothetical protein ACPPVO_24105 [Dactylosporangium sp. McL0621]|uniref:hypothetical protein n=1 Tax=Dactylosporangium sp. McL0621 TaxID=3415678 RepID=UPI003CEC66C2